MDKYIDSDLTRKMITKWKSLSWMQRFETLISLILMILIGIIVIISLIRLGRNIFELLVIHALDPLEFKTFQQIFGNILTLLIAMEFMRSIDFTDKNPLIGVRIILLIAILAISRKFIVMDSKTTSPEIMGALALILIALGITYWLIRPGNEEKSTIRDNIENQQKID